MRMLNRTTFLLLVVLLQGVLYHVQADDVGVGQVVPETEEDKIEMVIQHPEEYHDIFTQEELDEMARLYKSGSRATAHAHITREEVIEKMEGKRKNLVKELEKHHEILAKHHAGEAVLEDHEHEHVKTYTRILTRHIDEIDNAEDHHIDRWHLQHDRRHKYRDIDNRPQMKEELNDEL